MTDAELAHTKELAFFMVERVFMNPISAKLLSEDWRKEFPDEVAVAERMKALVEALEKAQQLATQQGNIACALFDEVTAQRQRIAELESRTVTVKLPPAIAVEDWMVDIDVYEADLVRALLKAAGIKWEAE
ncbi:hypothetical protein LRS35_17455 [Klebsiella variicola]|uniref:hypothetical protein n=1 Tax=Klebsiella variicola TaxID=244366 RepID=UPI0022AEE801|nr:hypothetical protein [Klebsiella variicola]MCZ3532919.1 hypothetical protein [Klebsiella variicola]